MDFEQLTLTEAASGLSAGTITSTALTREALARAKANAELNAFVTLDEAGALKAAAAFDAAGDRSKPLGGLPIVIKDNIEVAGLPCSAGTPALRDYVPKADAPVAARLRDAGAIIIGKTSMHELAFGISGYNTAFKTGAEFGVRNAYDRALIAGGSSSGTGAAIGARIVAGGLGTDTGGSVRVPAALNGCASLRPTVGRYPQAGIAPISHTRDTAGPMAATMTDVALLDRVIAGGDALAPADLRQVRVGLVKSMLANLDADTEAAFQAAVAKVRAQGVTVIEIEMPRLAELDGQASFPIALYEAYDDLVAYLKHTGTGLSIEAVAEKIASADVKGTYDGLVIPRKLPAPDGTLSMPSRSTTPRSGPHGQPCRRSTPSPLRTIGSMRSPSRPRRASPFPPIRSPAASKISACSSRTPIPAAMPAFPASRSRSRSAPAADCRSALSSTDPRAMIAACSRSAWRSTMCSDGCRRRVDLSQGHWRSAAHEYGLISFCCSALWCTSRSMKVLTFADR